MMILDPGCTMAPPPGLWFTTVPAGWVDVVSCCVDTLKPAFCSSVSAADCCLPSTLGTLTLPGPDETYSVTRVSAGTLLPSGGFDLITKPSLMLAFGWLMTVERRCWALICACAVATGSPFTSGTAYVLPAPASR